MNNKINLEEYFEKARNEEPVITSEDTRNLVESFPKSNLISSNHITQIFKGAKHMQILSAAFSSVAAVSALIYGIFSLTPGSNPNQIEPQNQANIVILDNSKHLETYSDNSLLAQNEVKAEKQIKVVVQKQQQNDKKENIDFQKDIKVDVKGIRLIHLNEAELNQLGIKTYPDRSLHFIAFKDKEMPIEIRISKENISSTNTLTESLENVNECPDEAPLPRFVTDDKGNRRLSLFSDKDMGAIIQTSSEITEDSENNTDKIVPSDKPSFPDGKETKSKMISSTIVHSTTAKSPEQITIKINSDVQDIQKNKVESIHNVVGGIEDSSQIPLKKGKLRKKIIVLKDCQNPDIHMNLDSLSTNILMQGGVFADSIFNFNFNFQDIPDLPELPELPEMEFLDSIIKNNCSNSTRISIFGNNFGDLFEEMNTGFEVNKLIPVSIRFDSPESPDNNCNEELYDYILWFDPTPELIAKLPEKIQNLLAPEFKALINTKDFCTAKAITGVEYFDVWRACNGSVENLNVFPNPAKVRINVSYTLKEKRTVYVSIHNLLGNKIKELRQSENFDAGTHQESFDLDGINPGMYLVVVETDKSEQAVQRVIVE